MSIILEAYEYPERGEFTIQQSVRIRITATEAKRKVKGWLLDEVSYMMGVETPTLIINTHAAWRVPVIFTASTHGKVGDIGYVDVNTVTGDMHVPGEMATTMRELAREMAKKLPPFKPFSVNDIPLESMPRDISNIPILHWPEDEDEPISLKNVTYYTG